MGTVIIGAYNFIKSVIKLIAMSEDESSPPPEEILLDRTKELERAAVERFRMDLGLTPEEFKKAQEEYQRGREEQEMRRRGTTN